MKVDSEQLIQERIRNLRENTDFLSALFDHVVGYAIIAADFDGNILAYSEGARLIYGYAPEEIIGQKNIETFFPKDFLKAGMLQDAISELIENGRFSYQGEQVRKTGDVFPVQALFTGTKGKSGKMVGFIEIVEDLTERRHAEQVLRESEERFRLAFGQAGVGMALVGLDGQFLDTNESLCRSLGYNQEDLMELSLQTVMHTDYLDSDADSLTKLMRGEALSFQSEKEFLMKSGKRRWFRMTVSLMRDEQGEPLYMITQLEDITERRQAEKAKAEARVNAARIELLESEIRSFEMLTDSPRSNVTALMFGIRPLRETLPDIYEILLQRYGLLLDMTLEQRVLRVEHDISESLSSMAEEMGRLKAGPRDVVEIHSNALTCKTNESDYQKSKAYVEEGRLMVLELMGRLLAFYRRYYQAPRTVYSRENGLEKMQEKTEKEPEHE